MDTEEPVVPNVPKTQVYTEDPFSYNFISLKKSKIDEMPTQSANQVIVNPLYNAVGKSLGIQDPHDWNKFYDKVFTISEWAKERSGLSDPGEILHWIADVSNRVPTLGSKKINDIYAHIIMGMEKGKNGA